MKVKHFLSIKDLTEDQFWQILKLVFVGDGDNNVASSLKLGCELVGIEYRACGPNHIKEPKKAVKDADVIVTDTWVSMRDEAEKNERLKRFKPYQVNESLWLMGVKV